MLGEIDLDKEHHRVIWRVAREQVQESELGIGMMEHNQIEGLLPVEYYSIDDKLQFRYSYGSLQRVSESLQEKAAGYDTIFFLCRGVLEIVDGGAEYLLEESGYFVMPEWVFWNHNKKSLSLCYLPGGKNILKKEYTTFVQYLMEHTDHSDKRAVDLIYGLYQYITSENFVIKDILEYLENHREKKEIPAPVDSHTGKKESFKKAPLKKERSCGFYVLSNVAEGKPYLSQDSNYIAEKQKIIVGRDKKADLCLPYQTISRRHAILFYEKGIVYIMDTDSKNGTYINGNKIPAYVKKEWKEEDILTFADISYRLQKKNKD